MQENDFGSLNRFNIVGSVRYRLGSGNFAVAPHFTYRRVGGVYQIFVPEANASFSLGTTVVSGAVRVGLVSDLRGGSGRTIPEGNITVNFQSGLYATAELSGNLPRLYGLGSLTESNPLEIDDLNFGLRVGYALDLDALW